MFWPHNKYISVDFHEHIFIFILNKWKPKHDLMMNDLLGMGCEVL